MVFYFRLYYSLCCTTVLTAETKAQHRFLSSRLFVPDTVTLPVRTVQYKCTYYTVQYITYCRLCNTMDEKYSLVRYSTYTVRGDSVYNFFPIFFLCWKRHLRTNRPTDSRSHDVINRFRPILKLAYYITLHYVRRTSRWLVVMRLEYIRRLQILSRYLSDITTAISVWYLRLYLCNVSVFD